jgi:hypothetical protein
MSELYPVIEIEYKNRKPSKAVVMRTIAEYLKQGGKAFTITWGENVIDLNYHPKHKHWYGTGWIRDISGQDIGEELNRYRKEAIEELKLLNLWNS